MNKNIKLQIIIFASTMVMWVVFGMLQQYIFMIKHDGWVMIYGWLVVSLIIKVTDALKQRYLQKDA